ncbi:UDP-N-acetylmuramoyl-L-alanyl-D-glutamate--2,6-diaminopimelate ligase [Paenibacillus lautus]|uniref:UDP-N-acetylmuramoyl-L-alanyl-D-glutamate--2, 6-diaminopimelate ligase n=1 Tax=Paenibacillus TaxID=44249 RepID=UPI002FBE6F3B
MNLHTALKPFVQDYTTIANMNITGVQFHSGKIQQGDVFVAINGTKEDGHHYIQSAIKAGASAVVGEYKITDLPVPYYRVSNTRRALAALVGHLYDFPSQRHVMIGITGTNGKTTTAHMLKHILEFAGVTCTLLGTVFQEINGQKVISTQTTPDSLQLNKWLNQSDDQVVIMEVSSHGIDQERIAFIEYDYAVFTNLSHDHLDYHHTLEDYFGTKARLFTQIKQNGESIISSHNDWGKRLIDLLTTNKMRVHTFGKSVNDDVQLTNIESEFPLTFQLKQRGTHYKQVLPIPGIYNAWNAVAAWLTASRMGIEPEVIQKALRTFAGVPGRFEIFKHPSGAELIVDYAHTPDGFHQFLRTIHSRTNNRVIHIFGFRGNGDPTKRKEMIRISVENNDMIVLTLDDLKGANKKEMLMEMRSLVSNYGKSKCLIIDDRTEAIEYVLKEAKKGDVVIITGKGRECYEQEFAIPSKSDIETIEYLLKSIAPDDSI